MQATDSLPRVVLLLESDAFYLPQKLKCNGYRSLSTQKRRENPDLPSTKKNSKLSTLAFQEKKYHLSIQEM